MTGNQIRRYSPVFAGQIGCPEERWLHGEKVVSPQVAGRIVNGEDGPVQDITLAASRTYPCWVGRRHSDSDAMADRGLRPSHSV
jgi:hypothetical protein